MTRMIRLTILSAMTLGLVACGGSKLGGGKQGAAQAAFQASQPAGRGSSKTGTELVNKALASGAATVAISANCTQGGKASLALDAGNTSKDGALHYVITYEACNEDGKNEYNGTMATSIKFALDPSYLGGSFVFSMKGKLDIDGEITDSLDTDVKMTMDFMATSANSGSVKLVLDGYIKTESGNYTYANETLSITAGELPKT